MLLYLILVSLPLLLVLPSLLVLLLLALLQAQLGPLVLQLRTRQAATSMLI
jgi:hypothetical protein